MLNLGWTLHGVICDWMGRICEISWFSLRSADARDKELLAQHNITHILSIHDTAAPILEVSCLCVSYVGLWDPLTPTWIRPWSAQPPVNSAVFSVPAALYSFWKCIMLTADLMCLTVFFWLNILFRAAAHKYFHYWWICQFIFQLTD